MAGNGRCKTIHAWASFLANSNCGSFSEEIPTAQMTPDEIGLPTYHTRVERWECDYNNHWNVRFYGRSFQMAAEAVASHGGAPNPGAEAVKVRHLRFHRELMDSAPVEVRSAVLIDAGEFDGAIVHLLLNASGLAATAIDVPGKAGHLPSVRSADVKAAMPRGIEGTTAGGDPGRAAVTTVELGAIRGEDLDHTGKLRFETLLRHGSNIQHAQFNRLGLTQEFAERHRINRMGVEFRVTCGMSPAAGALLRGRTWVTDIVGKVIWATNRITTPDDDLVATIEMCVVTVDLDTRKAVPVPEFMYETLGS